MEICTGCLKREDLCVCSALSPISTRLHVLFLQHPQEPDKELGTAWIAHKSLSNSTFRIGLSWPNLAKALGKPADPKRWLVLYLGSSKGSSLVTFLDRKGIPKKSTLSLKDLDGLVVLDGTWSQAKTLWWRNSWLLKLNRIALNPKRRSMYGRLRKEPRAESVSTIEAVGLTLSELEGDPNIFSQIVLPFAELLKRFIVK